jgi:hypothetical protein
MGRRWPWHQSSFCHSYNLRLDLVLALPACKRCDRFDVPLFTLDNDPIMSREDKEHACLYFHGLHTLEKSNPILFCTFPLHKPILDVEFAGGCWVQAENPTPAKVRISFVYAHFLLLYRVVRFLQLKGSMK